MSIFNKRKYEEEEYEDEDEPLYSRASVDRSEDRGEANRRYPRNKDFRDLKPENKRRRKEPLRPWGKKDRILVALLLLFTAGISSYLGLSARNWKLPGLAKINLKSLSNSFFGSDTIVLKGNNEDKKRADEVTSNFIKATDNLSGIYGFYIINLESGFSYGFLEEDTFQAASLIKLPLIAVMYQEAGKGSINLDDIYVLKNSDKVSGAGSLYTKPAGYQISYRNLIKLMGKESDNTAFKICRDLLGDERINEVAAKIGMSKTSVTTNETSPKDIGIFFLKLWKAEIVSQKDREEILSYLTDTIYENWLVAGVPKEVRVAHKYGREVHVVNDAGIVFASGPASSSESFAVRREGLRPGGKPYVVVIMAKGIVEREADEIFPNLSKIIYQGQTKD